eukprot:scaffold127598_cov57-Phaeocystis_antarctica.AAC.3
MRGSETVTSRACTSSTPKRHLTSPTSRKLGPLTVMAVLPTNGPPSGKICRTRTAVSRRCSEL